MVIGTGEAANATLVTGTAAPAVPGGTLRPSPTAVWRTDDRAASGNPLWVGTVVTWSEHTPRRARRHQRRRPLVLHPRPTCRSATRPSATAGPSCCSAATATATRLSTFDAQTGARGWFRTLPDDGEGRLQFGATGLVVTYAASFHAMTGQADGHRPLPDRSRSPAPTAGSPPSSRAPTGVLASERCADGEHLALWCNDGADGQAAAAVAGARSTDGVIAVAETTAAALRLRPGERRR